MNKIKDLRQQVLINQGLTGVDKDMNIVILDACSPLWRTAVNQ